MSTSLLYFAFVGLKFNGHANVPHTNTTLKKYPALCARRLATLLFLPSSVAAATMVNVEVDIDYELWTEYELCAHVGKVVA